MSFRICPGNSSKKCQRKRKRRSGYLTDKFRSRRHLEDKSRWCSPGASACGVFALNRNSLVFFFFCRKSLQLENCSKAPMGWLMNPGRMPDRTPSESTRVSSSLTTLNCINSYWKRSPDGKILTNQTCLTLREKHFPMKKWISWWNF